MKPDTIYNEYRQEGKRDSECQAKKVTGKKQEAR